MEIKPAGSQMHNQAAELTGRPAASGGHTREANFSEALKDSETMRRREACANLLQQIDTQSEELKKSPTPVVIKRYRKLVQAFMKEALNQTYTLNQQTHWDRSGNRKVFTTVKKINAAMEELADNMLNKEKKQIDMVARLDEIRGMLVDLIV